MAYRQNKITYQDVVFVLCLLFILMILGSGAALVFIVMFNA